MIVAPETAWSEYSGGDVPTLTLRKLAADAELVTDRCVPLVLRRGPGRRWRLSFAVLFDRTIRLRDGLIECFTRGLSCQQADEREHWLVGLLTDVRPASRATSDTARSRSTSSWRPVP